MIVGVQEIAAKVSRPKQTVLHWTNRKSFPAPVAKVSAGRFWDEDEVDVWLARYATVPPALKE